MREFWSISFRSCYLKRRIPKLPLVEADIMHIIMQAAWFIIICDMDII